MIKTRLIRIICLVVAFTSVFCLFDGFASTPVVADTVDDIEVLDEEVDPKHYQFVGRLYSIILRKDNCDPAEKEKLARKLDILMISLWKTFIQAATADMLTIRAKLNMSKSSKKVTADISSSRNLYLPMSSLNSATPITSE